eukprot:EG_transcript_43546
MGITHMTPLTLCKHGGRKASAQIWVNAMSSQGIKGIGTFFLVNTSIDGVKRKGPSNRTSPRISANANLFDAAPRFIQSKQRNWIERKKTATFGSRPASGEK